jgi:hypothetical protein
VNQHVPNYAAWDRAAAANWARVPEEQKEVWRDLVRERLPGFAKSPKWLEGLASGWAYDPRMVVGPATPETRGPECGPRRLFSDPETLTVRSA